MEFNGGSGTGGYKIITDGSGGAIFTWHGPGSNNTYDILSRRINASGGFLWGTVRITFTSGNQVNPQIVSDASSGAIITWEDQRNGNNDVYAQRVNSVGTVQWTGNGVAVCAQASTQSSLSICVDDSGGAIIVWQDTRNGNNDIYAQRVNNLGVVQWTTNGVAICTAVGDQQNPIIVRDGSGGAIITWQDSRSGVNNDIYAQRIDANGTIGWTENGVPICTAAGNQYTPSLVTHDSGGAIIAWNDYRSSTDFDLYAQRISSAGVVQWTNNGIAISTAGGDQTSHVMIADGSGSVIIAWQDYRNGTNYDIYAQLVTSSGALGTHSGKISGLKFNDVNESGTKDADEPGLANWRIRLAGVIIDSTLTDINGAYVFDSLEAGSYTVSEQQQVGWVQTVPVEGYYSITLSSGQNVTGMDFGNRIQTYTISASAVGNGAISPSGSVNVNFGAAQTFTMVPDSGYHIDRVVVDGTNQGSITNYTFYNVTTTHTITAYFSINLDTLLCQVNSRWNIVSVPLTVFDYSKITLYPSSTSDAYSYDNGYLSKTMLTNGIGYWMKFGSDQTISLAGLLRTEDTVEIKEGWNIVGSISYPVQVSHIISNPPNVVASNFYEYDNDYLVADTIQPGKGYWVKVNHSGTLILSTVGSTQLLLSRIKIVPTSELPPHRQMEKIQIAQLKSQVNLRWSKTTLTRSIRQQYSVFNCLFPVGRY